MSGHGTFLSDWMLSDGSHIGSASALMGVRNPDRPPSQPHPLRLRLPEIRAALLQQLAKNRTVAASLVFAVAADRQVGAMRERRQQIERPSCRRRIHLRFEGADKAFPFSLSHCRLALRHQRRAGREVGIPDIEPVVARVAVLANSARRTSHRADPNSFLRIAGYTEADDSQGHDAPIALNARAGLLAVFRPAGPMWANG